MAPKKKPTAELKDQRVPIMMSEDELRAVDDWSFAKRIRSRGEAIRRLCQIGILASAAKATLTDDSGALMDAYRVAIHEFPDIDAFSDANEKMIDFTVAMGNLGIKIDALESGETVEEARLEVEAIEQVAAEIEAARIAKYRTKKD